MRERTGEEALVLPDGRVGLPLAPGWEVRRAGVRPCRVCRRHTVFVTGDNVRAHPWCVRGHSRFEDYEVEIELERLDAVEPTPFPPPLEAPWS